MMPLNTISLLPIVDLTSIQCPTPGLVDADIEFCEQTFPKSPECVAHYERMRNVPHGEVVQCPHGFSSISATIARRRYAITSFIPYPRFGSKVERKLAKQYPLKKFTVAHVHKVISFVTDAAKRLEEIEASVSQQQSMALHEIRKLNRTIKHTAERMCSQPPQSTLIQKNELESIWKASELMSNQFDVLELIANEVLVLLPLNAASEPYKVFHKLERIYHFSQVSSSIRLQCPQGYFPKVRVFDKTFPILASVLLNNATKYSVPGTEISVDLRPMGTSPQKCRITISNTANDHPNLDDRIFGKGVRLAMDSDGTGKGLYLAQMVAKQHGGTITFRKSQSVSAPGQVKCFFSFDLPEEL